MVLISTDTSNIDSQCSLFNKKRELLASLIQVTQDLGGHTHCLQDMLLLARPSQEYPSKVQHYKDELDYQIRTLQEKQLLKRSDKYDSQTSHLLNSLLEFINLIQQQVNSDEEPNEFSDEVGLQLDEFDAVTKATIGIRIVLQNMGVFLPPVKFGFPQEWISEHIASLNETNHKLRLKVKDRIAELVYDAEHLLLNENLPASIRENLSYVQESMKVNLEYLFHGGNISHLPFDFESLDITATPTSTIHEHYIQQQAAQEAKENSTQEIPEKKPGFNDKLKRWLNTSWKTRWRDLD